MTVALVFRIRKLSFEFETQGFTMVCVPQRTGPDPAAPAKGNRRTQILGATYWRLRYSVDPKLEAAVGRLALVQRSFCKY
jgi:hypothetical protein